MPKMWISQYIERKLHFVKLQQILDYAKTEDISVYREEYTFRKVITNTSFTKNEAS